jgi:ABC transporter with metal-binding/Fe-S-binding domain ATP-binding protein
MKMAVLFSGGKDSVFAVYEALKQGHNVTTLITMAPKSKESYMFHYPNAEFTKYQAEAMGIEHVIWKTAGEKEKELEDLKAAIASVKDRIDCVAAGGLASEYQYKRIKSVCGQLGLDTFVPHWLADPERYWNLILSAGFRVMVTGVACEGLGKEWLGRVIDQKAFLELKKLSVKHRFHLAFEGGEAETFVTDGPIFRKRVEITDAETVWNRDSGFYLFRKARLAGKGKA